MITLGCLSHQINDPGTPGQIIWQSTYIPSDRFVIGMWKFRPKPLVSVIVASYNHEAYAATAVSSVLRQGVEDLEVIVVDDGSSDATPDVIERLGDPRVLIIRLAENRRVHPRNLALGLARGRYIAFQNSDDEWEDGKLSAQLEVLENNKQVVACFTGVDLIGKDGEPTSGTWANGLFTTENRTSARWLRHFFDASNCLCISSAVVRSRDVKKVGCFRPHLVQLSDLDLWVRLAAVGEFHIIDQPMTKMRVIPDRNISRPSPEIARRGMIEYAEVLARYAERPVCERILEAFHDVIPQHAQSPVAQLSGLAIHAWTLSPAHHLFADRVLSDILDSPQKREELVRVFGTNVIHTFIKKRGEIQFNLIREEQ